MKRVRYLSWLCVICLLFSGCKSTQQPSPETTIPATAAPPTTQTLPSAILPNGQLALQNPGKLRISYTTKRSSVQYITSASQLPKDDAFQKYDEAFFQTKALLLVTETVGSGSVNVSIASVTISDSTATVLLSHKMPGDAGTTDMATWLLWAEVDAGLDLQWTVANPAFENTLELQPQPIIK